MQNQSNCKIYFDAQTESRSKMQSCSFHFPDASIAPSHVHVTCISPTSAKIEWSPGNSSFSHEILVNEELYRTVRPGTLQHTITNLEPDHMYKVHVRAKNPKQVVEHKSEVDIEVDLLTAEVEFRTEPGGMRFRGCLRVTGMTFTSTGE